jgi:hypothetical protein
VALALVWLLAVAFGTGSVADAAASQGASIQVTVVPTRMELPRRPAGRTGDTERVVWSVRDRYGRTIGVGLFSCRWVLRTDRLCTGEIQMPLGKIAILGSSSTRELGVYSVVGGTGRYVGASGELAFRAIGIRKLVVSMTV